MKFGTDIPDRALGARITGGAVWAAGARWGERSLGLLSTVVLARLLMPEDFGLIAMSISVWMIMERFLSIGAEQYLIRTPEIDKETYDTVWTINLIRGLFVIIVINLSAEWLAGTLDEARLVLLLRL